MVTLRATEHQKVKVKAFDYLMANHRGDIKNALVTNDKKRKPLEPTGEHADLRLVTYYVKGRLMGKYVDPYIADSLDNHTVEENSKVISALRMINDPFRRVYTTYNPGFMGFNVYRDFIRTWKNTPNVSMLQLMKRYWQAVPLARLRAFGLSEKPTAAQLEAWEHLLTAEEKGILSTTFNDTFHGHTIEETQIANILARYGAGSFNKARHPLLRPIVALANGMRNAGDFFETLPKAAMMYEYMGEGSVADLTAEQRHFLRTRVGSPDFLAGGTWTPVTNNLFLFSNAVAQGWRTDLEVAVGPTTRSGFVWKTAAVNLVPKILMMAALMAAAGSAAGGGDDDANWLERALAKVPFLARAGQLLRRASRYDLTNYIVIPFGEDAEGNTIYLRLPQDDTGRFLGGLAWKLLEAAVGRRDEGVLQTIADIVNYTQGQIPSMAPIFDILSTAGQYAAKQNPYDYFRGRNLLTEDEQKARFAKGSQNWDAFGKFLGWEAKQFGADIIYKFYGGESKPTTRTPGQVFLDLPVISNAVGRFLRVTNYGELEHRRDVGAGIEADRAAGRLAENKAMNRKIAEYRALPAAQQNPRTQIRMAQEVQHELYASERDPKKRAEITRRLQNKFRRSLVRGESDTIADALLSATSNPEKVAILLDARQSMRREVFDTWLRDAVRQKVVSEPLRDLLHKRLRQRALVAQ